MKIHHEQVLHQLHVACHEVADNAAKVALEATLVAADKGYLVIQVDDGTVWQCVAAATLVFIGNNLSGEGYSVDGDGTITLKLGDAAGAEKVSITDSADAEQWACDSNGIITGNVPDHLHAGVAGDGEQIEADDALLATGDADGEILYAQGDNSVAWETARDHLHAGVAGDGGQIEADATLLATGDTAGDILAADGANGVLWNTPGTAYYTWFDITYAAEGVVAAAAGALRYYAPIALTIDKVYISVNTAPTGDTLICDVHKNGVTIFTAQANRPTIAAAAFTDESGAPDITALAMNDYVQVDIDQIGSAVAGADLTVHIRCKQFLQVA